VRVHLLTLLSFFAVLLGSCASSANGGIEVTDVMVVLPVSGSMEGMEGMSMNVNLAGYFTIKNNSKTDDRLLKVTCDFAETMLHETKLEGDVASMSEIYYVDVPVGSTIEFNTGGKHVMFTNVKKELKIGDTVNLYLQFENAGTITVTAVVIGH